MIVDCGFKVMRMRASGLEVGDVEGKRLGMSLLLSQREGLFKRVCGEILFNSSPCTKGTRYLLYLSDII